MRGGGKINVHIRSDGEGVYGMGKGRGGTYGINLHIPIHPNLSLCYRLQAG